MVTIEEELKEIETLLLSKLNQLLNLYKEKRSLEEFVKEKGLTDEYRVWRNIFYHNRNWKREE